MRTENTILKQLLSQEEDDAEGVAPEAIVDSDGKTNAGDEDKQGKQGDTKVT